MNPNPYLEDPDVILFLEFQKGDSSAFETLMKKYFKRILNFINRFIGNSSIAEDLTQEVFIRVYNSVRSYQPQAKFQTWIFKIARNVSLNELRKHKPNMVSLDEVWEVEDSEVKRQVQDLSLSGPDKDILEDERLKVIEAAINSLPENQRTVILLRRYDEFSYEDIAHTMNCSVEAVKSLLSRARENLKLRMARFFKE